VTTAAIAMAPGFNLPEDEIRRRISRAYQIILDASRRGDETQKTAGDPDLGRIASPAATEDDREGHPQGHSTLVAASVQTEV